MRIVILIHYIFISIFLKCVLLRVGKGLLLGDSNTDPQSFVNKIGLMDNVQIVFIPPEN